MYYYTNKRLLLESYEVISEVDENLIEQVLFEAKDVSDSKIDAAIKVHKENIKAIEKIVKENGIDTSSIKNAAKTLANFAKNAFKKNVPVEKASKEAINRIGKQVFKQAIKKYKELDMVEKVGLSILMFIVILFLNTFAQILLGIGLGRIGYFVLLVIVAPLIEEAAKRYAIIKKYPIVFNTIFAGTEALMYISKMINTGVSLPAAIITRALTACMHFSTLFVQMHYHKRAEEEDNSDLELKGYLIAFTIHSLWNSISIIIAMQHG